MDKVSKQAIILGNGESRIGFDYREKYPNAFVYGCNGAYREEPDALIVTDVGMQPIVYDTGYCQDHLCYFPEWEPIPEEMAPILIESMGNTHVVENTKGNRTQCVISGTSATEVSQHTTYATWVDNDDCVVKIQDRMVSSGSHALLLACEAGHEEIYLLGFDGVGAENIYRNTRGYERTQPRDRWVAEREQIKQQFPHITFYDL